MKPTPLSDEDLAILRLEGPTIAGHTCKVIRLERSVGVPELRERIDARLGAAPILRARLRDQGRAAWVEDPDFAIERQVVSVSVSGPIAERRLPALVAGLFEQRLERDRPLWRIDAVELEGGGTALVWRLHHALADGTTAMRFARALLWDEAPSEPPARGRHPGRRPAGSRPIDGDDDRRRRGHLAAFLEREFVESLHRSPFEGEIGARRRVGFASVPLQPLHDAGKRICGASVNDSVLCVVAGGLRAWLEHHHGAIGALRFRVPVSLHSEADDASNRDSFFTLPVHLDEADPVARLRAIHAQEAERKADHDAERLQRMLTGLRSELPPLASLAERLEASSRSFALCVSNVPGPRQAVSVGGVPVHSLHSLAEIGRGHALRVAVVSLAGTLHFGICSDPAIADDVAQLATGIEGEAAALSA